MQVRVLSLPLIDRDVLLGEQSSSNLDAEGSTPSVLAFVSVAEQPRHHLAEVDRRFFGGPARQNRGHVGKTKQQLQLLI